MIGRFANGLAAVLGAVLLVQFPAFYQQYLQRLGGRLDQLRADKARLLEDAESLGVTLQEYLEALADAGLAAKQSALREMARLAEGERLEQAYAALAGAPAVERPLLFAQYFDPAVAESTFRAYVPAVPFSLEGLVYAALGLALGLFLLAGGEKTARLPRDIARRRARKRAKREQEALLTPEERREAGETPREPRLGSAPRHAETHPPERREPEFRST